MIHNPVDRLKKLRKQLELEFFRSKRCPYDLMTGPPCLLRSMSKCVYQRRIFGLKECRKWIKDAHRFGFNYATWACGDSRGITEERALKRELRQLRKIKAQRIKDCSGHVSEMTSRDGT